MTEHTKKTIVVLALLLPLVVKVPVCRERCEFQIPADTASGGRKKDGQHATDLQGNLEFAAQKPRKSLT